MIYVEPLELRKVVFKFINSTIHTHREFKRNYFWFEYYPFVTDCEINDFINSNPFFDFNLKTYLTSLSYEEKATAITKEWHCKFCEKVDFWSQSKEWLFYGSELIYASPFTTEAMTVSDFDILCLTESLHKIKLRHFIAKTFEVLKT